MNDQIKESLIGITKASISSIPIAGGMLNELLFDIRGRIAQNRINRFIESFLQHLTEIGVTINYDHFTTESFNDIYFSIIRKVTETNSEHKLMIFKKVLASNVDCIYESSHRETFLDLVLRLDHIQIEILRLFRETGRSGSLDIDDGFQGSISEITSKSCKQEIIETIKKYQPDMSTLNLEGKYEFYICDLISKSLLVDKKTAGNTLDDLSHDGFTVLYITDYGKEFLNFIVEA